MKKKTGSLFSLPVAGFFILALSSCVRSDNLGAFEDDTTSRAVAACTPTNIVPYIQVNDQQWILTPETIVAPGSKVTLGPQPNITSGWSWTGGGTSGTNREQTIYPTQSVYPVAHFTNSCGATEPENFTIHVTHAKDWGFESGGFTHWSGYGQYAIVNNGNAYSGTYAGRIYSTGGSSGITQTVTGLTPNTDYVLKAWVKTTANSVALGVQDFGGGNLSVTTSSSQYVLLSKPFKTGASATSALVYLWRNTSGYAYIDDVIVERSGPSGGSVSGEPVPIGDIGVWKQIFYDDFTKDAPIGSWASDCDPNKIVYTGAQGQQWKAYPKCYLDTRAKRPYRSDSVLSVKNGTLNFYLHRVDGQPAGANPSPVINNGSQYQTYGRYTARFKVDNPNLSEYYVAWLLWPQTEIWPDDGEEDWPEGGLAGNIGGFHHYAGAGACIGCQDVATTTAKFTDWHTFTVEWRPGNIKYFLDGNLVLNSNNWVPTKPMRWQLQTETNGNGNHSGNLIVDWVAVYKYAP